MMSDLQKSLPESPPPSYESCSLYNLRPSSWHQSYAVKSFMNKQLAQQKHVSVQSVPTITFNDNPIDLGRIPVELSECPQCQQQCKTKIEFESFLWRFLPGFNSLKNIDHYCSECGAFIDTQYEKVPNAPPSYSEVYPSAPNESFANNPVASPNIGWQPNQGSNVPHQQSTTVPMIQQLPQMPNMSTQVPQIITILQNQSRVGMYPVKLSPCPHCQKDGSTMIKYDNTIRTHLFSLILCLFCCCPCAAAPYLCSDSCRCLKNPSHFCSNCKSYIGTYNNNPLAL
ncbi:unnamed protein product [Diamesa serratosioi]